MLLRIVSFLVLFLSLGFPAFAQVDTDSVADAAVSNRPGGAYCNVFYVTSFNTDVLPFDDVCFVVDEYSMGNAKSFRCIGPIKGTIDLFRSYPWSIRFHMPYVTEGERLVVKAPADLNTSELDMAPGEFFISLSESEGGELGRNTNLKMDFAASKGKATITEYKPMQGEMKFPEYTAQIDLYFRKVDHSSGTPTMTGAPIRVKMVLRVESLQ